MVVGAIPGTCAQGVPRARCAVDGGCSDTLAVLLRGPVHRHPSRGHMRARSFPHVSAIGLRVRRAAVGISPTFPLLTGLIRPALRGGPYEGKGPS